MLNEPEASLHPDLFEPLAGLITTSAQRAQTIVVTHSTRLRRALEESATEAHLPATHVELVKEGGETNIVGQGMMDVPAWKWPAR